MKKMSGIILSFLLSWSLFVKPISAELVYQNFEPGNGTTKQFNNNPDAHPVYGWGFNGAVVNLTAEDDPVHEGLHAWAVTTPAGPPVEAGTAVISQVQSYNMNFVPRCYDRLTFWIWSEPSKVGNHTVMVKFFDQEKYKINGIGIWTQEAERARYNQWTKLKILFNQLPTDFNLGQVHKIEFFNYWDGTYYYDDIQLETADSAQKEAACLESEFVMACKPAKDGKDVACVPTYSQKGLIALDYLFARKPKK